MRYNLFLADIVASQSSHWGGLGSPKSQFPGKIFCRQDIQKGKRLEFMWKNPIRTQNDVFLKGTSHHQQNKSVIKSTVTMKDRHSIDNKDGSRSNTNLHEDSMFPNSRPFTQGSREIDEKEKLRRMRISKANKGNVPWNKGRRHSAGAKLERIIYFALFSIRRSIFTWILLYFFQKHYERFVNEQEQQCRIPR